MREILFRAKRIDNGEWVEGYLVRGNRTYIITLEAANYMVVSLSCMASVQFVEVIPETVGQFTGLTDKNGTKIFEGDIVISHSRSVDENDGPAQIEWDEDTARFIIVWNTLLADFDNFYSHDLEVVGNIHDNPELLESEVTNEDQEN